MSTKYINSYETAAEYGLDTRPADGSSISLIGSSDVRYDSVNVVVKTPKVGDAVYINESQNSYQYVDGESLNTGSMDSAWTAVGVVAAIIGNEALVVHKTNVGKKWADVYRWTVRGWETASGAREIKLNNTSSYATWTPDNSNLDNFMSSFNTFITGSEVATGVKDMLHMYAEDISGTLTPILTMEPYTYYPGTASLGTELSLTAYNGEEYPANSSGLGNHTLNTAGTVKTAVYCPMNFDKTVEFFKAGRDWNGSLGTGSNWSSSASSPVYPCCENSYIGLLPDSKVYNNGNGEIYKKYGPGREGWLKYIKDCMSIVGNESGTAQNKWQDGHKLTYAHAGKQYTSKTGEMKHVYTAIEYCKDVNYNVDKFRTGDWFLPSLYQLNFIESQIKYGTIASRDADPINKTLLKIGGSAISNGSGVWSSCRNSSNSAWYCNGHYGFCDFNSFYNSFLAIPCMLLKI